MRNRLLLGMAFALQAQSAQAELCSNFYRYLVKAPSSFIEDRGEKSGRGWSSVSNPGCNIFYNNGKHRISCNIYSGTSESKSKSDFNIVKDDLSNCIQKSSVSWKNKSTDSNDEDFVGRNYTWYFSSDKGLNQITAEYYLDKESGKYYTFIGASFQPD